MHPADCPAYREQRLEEVRCPALRLARDGRLLEVAQREPKRKID